MRVLATLILDRDALFESALAMPSSPRNTDVESSARLRARVGVRCDNFHGAASDDPSSQRLAIEKLLQPALACVVNLSCEITP